MELVELFNSFVEIGISPGFARALIIFTYCGVFAEMFIIPPLLAVKFMKRRIQNGKTRTSQKSQDAGK